MPSMVKSIVCSPVAEPKRRKRIGQSERSAPASSRSAEAQGAQVEGARAETLSTGLHSQQPSTWDSSVAHHAALRARALLGAIYRPTHSSTQLLNRQQDPLQFPSRVGSLFAQGVQLILQLTTRSAIFTTSYK
jgi:hypothetical protein